MVRESALEYEAVYIVGPADQEFAHGGSVRHGDGVPGVGGARELPADWHGDPADVKLTHHIEEFRFDEPVRVGAGLVAESSMVPWASMCWPRR